MEHDLYGVQKKSAKYHKKNENPTLKHYSDKG